MKKITLLVVLLLLLTSCKEEVSKKESINSEHFYSFKEGKLYGYEQQQNQDTTEKPLIMMQYAGQKNDTYQLFYLSADNKIINVIECQSPCVFMKQSTFYNIGDGQFVSKEYFRVGKDSIAKYAITDAMKGNLERTIVSKGNKKYNVWFSNKAEFTPSD